MPGAGCCGKGCPRERRRLERSIAGDRAPPARRSLRNRGRRILALWQARIPGGARRRTAAGNVQSRGVRGRTATSKASTANSGTNPQRGDLHNAEGGKGVDGGLGTISGNFTGARGAGSLNSRVSFTVLGRSDAADMQFVMAHEIGHTMSLLHPPCGDAGFQDPSYPYDYGSIGVWGYDFRMGGSLVEPNNTDLMSYCGQAPFLVEIEHRLG